MSKSFPYMPFSHVGVDRWRRTAELVHESGKSTTGYTVQRGGVRGGGHKASRRSASLRKLYSFIIIRNLGTAALPVVATLFVSSVLMASEWIWLLKGGHRGGSMLRPLASI